MENGKLLESAVLLLAAEEQIRDDCSSKINGNYKRDDVSNSETLCFPKMGGW
jgi:hypothetical protein